MDSFCTRITREDYVGYSTEFVVFALLFCFIASLFGFICNNYLLIRLTTTNESLNCCQKLCRVKTIPNIIVCSSFIFFDVPLTALCFTYNGVPFWLNKLNGAVAGTWAYSLSPMIQACLSCNRMYVLYFPFEFKLVKRFPLTKVATLTVIILASGFTGLTLRKECGYLFDPQLFLWIPEDVCAEKLSSSLLFAISLLAGVSNSFNIATGLRLLMNKMSGLSKRVSSKRRKKWMILFVQIIIQDCLHLIDIINATYIWKLSDQLWFQCIFLTFSFVFIYSMDGFVMLVCNRDVRLNWCKMRRKKMRVIVVNSTN